MYVDLRGYKMNEIVDFKGVPSQIVDFRGVPSGIIDFHGVPTEIVQFKGLAVYSAVCTLQGKLNAASAILYEQFKQALAGASAGMPGIAAIAAQLGFNPFLDPETRRAIHISEEGKFGGNTNNLMRLVLRYSFGTSYERSYQSTGPTAVASQLVTLGVPTSDHATIDRAWRELIAAQGPDTAAPNQLWIDSDYETPPGGSGGTGTSTEQEPPPVVTVTPVVVEDTPEGEEEDDGTEGELPPGEPQQAGLGTVGWLLIALGVIGVGYAVYKASKKGDEFEEPTVEPEPAMTGWLQY